MRISVRQQGGAYDIDEAVEIEDDRVRTRREGAPEAPAQLDARSTDAIQKLANVVKTAKVTAARGPVYDQMTTFINIDDGESNHQIVVRSGDDAPPELWELVNLVKDAPAQAAPPES